MSIDLTGMEPFGGPPLWRIDNETALGFIPTFVVGRRYYTTSLPPNGALLCEREPENPHDGEAIAVYAERGGQKLGHLPRYDAATLAPLLDRGAIRLSALAVGPDDPQGRTPVYVTVFPGPAFPQVLEGAGGSSLEALWHSLMLATWHGRHTLTSAALTSFRDQVRDLAHSGKLWPETQLFYRLLKGVCLAQEAAEKQKEELARQTRAEEERRRHDLQIQNWIASTDCEAVGGLQRYGRFAILPLRALRPAECLSLVEALKASQASILQTCKSGKSQWFILTAPEAPKVLATIGECLDTTEGRFHLGNNYLIYPKERRCIKVLPDADVRQQKIILLKELEDVRPHLPNLPGTATGFALFADGALFELDLFARHANAAAHYEQLTWGSWQLASNIPPPDVATACEQINQARSHFFTSGKHLDSKDYLADDSGNLLRLILRPMEKTPPMLIGKGNEEVAQ